MHISDIVSFFFNNARKTQDAMERGAQAISTGTLSLYPSFLVSCVFLTLVYITQSLGGLYVLIFGHRLFNTMRRKLHKRPFT